MTVTIEEALQKILAHVPQTSTKILPIEEVLGMVIAEDIYATHNLPPYDNSAMDGYAVKVEDGGKCVQVACTIFAGDNITDELHANQAYKIMTGAKIPLGTQTVVPIEDTTECEDGVELPKNLTLSKHIRFAGEDIKKGTLLLHKGDQLNAYHITLLASQGISHIKVFKKPRVAVFASGNELKMHFERVKEYQLYNTNAPMILARVQELGCDIEFIGTAQDTLEDIHEHITSALECDLIITSGGVSVGDADYTKEAFKSFGHTIVFDKVAIKPGKPTTFGTIGKTIVLNLPGNPLAAALNFEIFGRTIIAILRGQSQKFIQPLHATLKENITLKGDRSSVIPGFYDGHFFTPENHFAPGMVAPLARNNGFIISLAGVTSLKKNTHVQFISTEFALFRENYHSIFSS